MRHRREVTPLTSSGVKRPIACIDVSQRHGTGASVTRTESSVESVASTMAFFFSCNYSKDELKRSRHGYAAYLDNATFNTVFDHKLDGFDRTVLSKTMNSVHGLCIIFSTQSVTTLETHTIFNLSECSSVRMQVRHAQAPVRTAGFHQLSMR